MNLYTFRHVLQSHTCFWSLFIPSISKSVPSYLEISYLDVFCRTPTTEFIQGSVEILKHCLDSRVLQRPLKLEIRPPNERLTTAQLPQVKLFTSTNNQWAAVSKASGTHTNGFFFETFFTHLTNTN